MDWSYWEDVLRKITGSFERSLSFRGGSTSLIWSLGANRDSKPREDMSRRIKTRCLALCRDLLPPSKRETGTIDDLEVVEEAVGLRPTREGGIRLEVEEIKEEGRRLKVVHHYGRESDLFVALFAELKTDLVFRSI